MWGARFKRAPAQTHLLAGDDVEGVGAEACEWVGGWVGVGVKTPWGGQGVDVQGSASGAAVRVFVAPLYDMLPIWST